ncbi:MAG: hypothetical protein PF440_11960 [Thiomicrorhabdus sp.]|jgi:hypothetical protein|nr:hypothetical protein [Thiomicrorhabdus sp.]
MTCKNRVTQYVPNGYGRRTVQARCGTTGIHGQILHCESCQKIAENKYPQGWRHVPGDLCPHGNYIGDAGGPDILCGQCEEV